MVAKVLEHPTLVLNRNWQPVNVATVARALVLLWNESARVVDPADYRLYTWADWSQLRPREGEQFIQAVRLRLRVPEVIVLAEYDRLPTAAVSFSRRNVFKRDHWACQYCGCQPGGDGAAQATKTAGDQRHLAREVEEIGGRVGVGGCCGHWFTCLICASVVIPFVLRQGLNTL